MKKFFESGLLFCLAFVANAQPTFQWARACGGSSRNVASAHATVIDASGNVYSAGMFEGTVDFDPGPGVYNLTSAGFWDVFVYKLDPASNFLWAIRIGSPDYNNVISLSSGSAGDLYLTGDFGGTTDFNPGTASYTMATGSGTVLNHYFLKLDANGAFLWAKELTSNQGPGSFHLSRFSAVDALGNFYTAGQFKGVQDVDPGPGAYTLNSAITNVFVLKLDIAGNFIWAAQLGGAWGHCVNVDASGNIYATGSFSGTADFDPGPATFNLTSLGGTDGFIAKLNNNGNFIWAKQIGGNLDDLVLNMEIDCNGDLISTGTFQGSLCANPASTLATFSSFGRYDIFVSKLDANGSYIWAKQIGGSQDETAILCLDKTGDIYLTGQFGTTAFWIPGFTADFDPGPAVHTLTTVGFPDIFYSKLDGTGNFIWAYSAGSPYYDGNGGIRVADNFDIYISGAFRDTVDFNPFTPVVKLGTPMGSGAFTLKFSQPNVLLPIVNTSGATVCSGNSASIVASGSGLLNWYSSATSTIPIGSGQTFVTPSLTNNTTFYLSSVVCGTNSPMIATTVSVNPLPVVTAAANNTVVCTGNLAVLSASGAAGYTWSTSQTTPSITVVVVANNIYSVTGADQNSCAATATVALIVSNCAGIYDTVDSRDIFRVYPNPSNGEVFIESDRTQIFILSDEIGRTIRTISVKESKRISDLLPGIYFITPDPQSGLKPQKLVLVR